MASDFDDGWAAGDVNTIIFNIHDPYPFRVECIDGSPTAGKKETYEYEWADIQTAWSELSAVAVADVEMAQGDTSVTFYWS